MYIWWFLKLLVFFFTYHAYQVLSTKIQILIKQPTLAITVHSGTKTIIGALVYLDIPSNLRPRSEQSHHLPGALLPRWVTQATNRVSNERPHLQLYKKCVLGSPFTITFSDYGKKVSYLKSISLAVEFIYLASSADCVGPINRSADCSQRVNIETLITVVLGTYVVVRRHWQTWAGQHCYMAWV